MIMSSNVVKHIFTITDVDSTESAISPAKKNHCIVQRSDIDGEGVNYNVSGDIFSLFGYVPSNLKVEGRLLGGSDIDSSDISLSSSATSYSSDEDEPSTSSVTKSKDAKSKVSKTSKSSKHEDLDLGNFERPVELVFNYDEAKTDMRTSELVAILPDDVISNEDPLSDLFVNMAADFLIEELHADEPKPICDYSKLNADEMGKILARSFVIADQNFASLRHTAAKEERDFVRKLDPEKSTSADTRKLAELSFNKDLAAEMQRSWRAAHQVFIKNEDRLKEVKFDAAVRSRIGTKLMSATNQTDWLKYYAPDQIRAGIVARCNLDKFDDSYRTMSGKRSYNKEALLEYILNDKRCQNICPKMGEVTPEKLQQVAHSAVLNHTKDIARDDPLLKHFDVTQGKGGKFNLSFKNDDARASALKFDGKFDELLDKLRDYKVNLVDRKAVTYNIKELRDSANKLIEKYNNNLKAVSTRRSKVDNTKVVDRFAYRNEKLSGKLGDMKASKSIRAKFDSHRYSTDKGKTSELLASIRDKAILAEKGRKSDVEKLLRIEKEKDVKSVIKALKDAGINKDDPKYKEEKANKLSSLRHEHKANLIKEAAGSNKMTSKLEHQSGKFARGTDKMGKDGRGMYEGKASAKFITKTGDHSISLNYVINVDLDPALSNTAQNCFAWARQYIYDTRNRVYFNTNLYTWDVSTTTFTPPTVNRVAYHEHVHGWDRFYYSNAMPSVTHLNYGRAVQKDMIDVQRTNDYIKESMVVNTKPTADALMSELSLPKHIAEVIAPKIANNIVRYNNSAIFTQLVMLACMIDDLNKAGVDWAISAQTHDTVKYIDIAPQSNPNANATLSKQIDEMNEQGMFTFKREEVSDTDIQIMEITSMGFKGIRTRVEGLKHLFESFEMDNPRWAILHKNDNMHMTRMNRITSESIWRFMFMMADNLGMKNDLVEGVTNAIRIMNGNLEDSKLSPIYFTCTLETKKIVLPKPHAHNVLWRLLKKEQPEVSNDHLKAEYDLLRALDIHEYQLISCLLSHMMSSSVSTVFHRYNLTGREINDMAAANVSSPSAHPLMRSLFELEGNRDRCAILAFMCGIMSQMAGIAMNSGAFRESAWSNALQWGRRLLDDDEVWCIRWRRRVPYLFDPIVLAPYCNGLPTEWGISMPRQTFNAVNDSIIYGGEGMMAWYASAGDSRYSTILTQRVPQRYVDYAAHAINFMLQHSPFNLQQIPHINYEIRVNIGGDIKVQAILEDGPQPELARGIRRIMPGTLINYNWATQRQLVPVIYSGDFGDNLFELIASMQVVDSMFSGICWELSVHTTPVVDNTRVNEDFSSMDMFKRPDVTTRTNRRFGQLEN